MKTIDKSEERNVNGIVKKIKKGYEKWPVKELLKEHERTSKRIEKLRGLSYYKGNYIFEAKLGGTDISSRIKALRFYPIKNVFFLNMI